MKRTIGIIKAVWRRIVSRTLAFIYCGNKKLFYAEFHGTRAPSALFLKNILNPNRLWEKARWGQIRTFPSSLVKSKPAQPRKPVFPETRAVEQKYSEEFLKNGYLILPDYFLSEVKQLRERYRLDNSFRGQNVTYLDKRFDPRKEDLICKMSLDPLILQIVADKFRAQPVMRSQPFILSSFPYVDYVDFLANRTELLKKDHRMGNMCWHYDTPNQICIHVLLEDCTINDTHMLLAKKTADIHHAAIDEKFDYFYSEEYMREKFEILPCIGKAGTAIIFDQNSLHRMNPIKNTYRCLFSTIYTPGNTLQWMAEKVCDVPNPTRLLEPQDHIKNIPAPDLNKLDPFQTAVFDWFPPVSEGMEKKPALAAGKY